jgi:hypothetical protein
VLNDLMTLFTSFVLSPRFLLLGSAACPLLFQLAREHEVPQPRSKNAVCRARKLLMSTELTRCKVPFHIVVALVSNKIIVVVLLLTIVVSAPLTHTFIRGRGTVGSLMVPAKRLSPEGAIVNTECDREEDK